ncbi:ATP-binding cassette domain-containing protein [Rhizobium sp. AAP43]|uniref:ATP-binding cassette domain-containing protein n=1 Tax=Rhizobium sp. AAP43 TaxID=1523420 RepID=UPI0009E9E7A2|nr:ATP-binding cassette domain-containing protein [Rhizobium sp. AAP43]
MRTIEGNSTGAPVTLYRAPVAILLIMTMALNILSLTVPLAAQLIFNRILPSPGSSTLSVVVGAVAILAIAEAVIRLARGYIMLEAGRVTTADITRKLLSRLIASDYTPGSRGAARSLDYFTRIAQVSERHSGKLLVAAAELMFLPVILFLIFAISPTLGALFCICLFAGLQLSLNGATALRRQAALLNRLVERRYRFLLGVLSAIHHLKAQVIEEPMLRRYEEMQRGIARTSMRTADASNHLLNGVLLTNQAITITALIYGAYAINSGIMTLGALSAVILLGGRLIAPVQRAVFILVQARDLCDAEDVVSEIMHKPVARPATEPLLTENLGRLELSRVGFKAGETPEYRCRNIDLALRPGEMIALAGPDKMLSSRLLRIMAGIERPDEGKVTLNSHPIDDFPLGQLNRSVAYVSGNSTLFAGTIRDNITRFGEVSLEEAWSVALLMGIQGALNELPRGLDTPVTGTASENLPTSLCQQLAILRAIVLRPRILLLDDVDRGLDRQSYGNLQRFMAAIRGQATMVIVSDDRNLTAGAERSLMITESGLRPDEAGTPRSIATYRNLVL